MASKSKSSAGGSQKKAGKSRGEKQADIAAKPAAKAGKKAKADVLKAEVAAALKEKLIKERKEQGKMPAKASSPPTSKPAPRRSVTRAKPATAGASPSHRAIKAASKRPASAPSAESKASTAGIGHNSLQDESPKQASEEQALHTPAYPGLAEWNQWAETLTAMQKSVINSMPSHLPGFPMPEVDVEHASTSTVHWMRHLPRPSVEEQQKFTSDALALINGFWDQLGAMGEGVVEEENVHVPILRKDRRFSGPEWQGDPLAALTHQFYLLFADHLKQLVQEAPGLEKHRKSQLEFGVKSLVDALSPSNFPLTNPKVLQRAIETNGESIVKGVGHALNDAIKGQLSQVDSDAFVLGENIASTPGKVIYQTKLFQLIHYTPTTDKVDVTPLLIFPPWINRFYILDLTPQKSFVRWCVDQGLSVFIVSWKSADDSLVDIRMDDYSNAMIEAMDVVRQQLDVPKVHTIGYCVAGTVLAATLAVLAARGESDRVASATFFTAQVDFEEAGELLNFIDDEQLGMLDQVYSNGVLDGRYIATAFNMLRGNDLIWNYVVNNYLLGADYQAFDLLYWNSDYTNLPAGWHKAYLQDLYRDNKLVKPGAITIGGTPVDLTMINTPCFVQAGREDHIAPLASVWKLTQYVKAPLEFCLAGSGHIAGVVNPPEARKYQYWTSTKPLTTLDAFIDDAVETPGSWWPHWRSWLVGVSDESVSATDSRIPGNGPYTTIEDAPGTYVQMK